jgi:cobalt-zinc-cadmium efflux system membrane fusion protein
MARNHVRIAAVLVLVGSAHGPAAHPALQRALAEPSAGTPEPVLVPGEADTLRLPPELVRSLGIQTAAAVKASKPRLLHFAGVLAPDGDRVVRVHSRCAGEVVEVGQVRADGGFRPLRVGDRVGQGQVLAVIWSKQLGEEKGRLLDALSRLLLDREELAQVEAESKKGTIPEAALRQARRKVKAGLTAVVRAERTLHVWGVSEAAIQAVRAEAERLARGQERRDADEVKQWARVEVRAPQDGTLLEKNLARGEMVEPSSALFQLADLSRLSVLAEVHEKDLPALRALPAQQRRWTIRLPSDPAAAVIFGMIDSVGPMVDPKTHAAVARAPVDNGAGRLLAGQAVVVEVAVPPAPDEVAVPAAAVIEEKGKALVVVQSDPAQPVYAQRRVLVTRRDKEVAHVRDRLSPEEERQGLGAVRPGERIVTAGVAELKAALRDLQAKRGR